MVTIRSYEVQCNPPERGPRQEKVRPPIELFIRHLIYDVLSKKAIDKVLKLLRKLDWDDPHVRRVLNKVFAKPWKIRYSNIGLLATLTYDLQRYRPAFSIAVVDQVLEDIRRGLEQNVYSTNQRRLATIKYLGELYIYRLIGSGIIFDTLWSIVTFGHPEGRPMPQQPLPIDMPDDFFRIRLVCVVLDTCGMCFDRGTQKKKLDSFLTFFFVGIFSDRYYRSLPHFSTISIARSLFLWMSNLCSQIRLRLLGPSWRCQRPWRRPPLLSTICLVPPSKQLVCPICSAPAINPNLSQVSLAARATIATKMTKMVTGPMKRTRRMRITKPGIMTLWYVARLRYWLPPH